MRLSAKTFAAMLMGLALTVFQLDLSAQSRGNARSSSAGSRQTSSTSGRKTGSTSVKSDDKKSNRSTRKADMSPADRTPSKPSSGKPAAKPADKPGTKPESKPAAKPSDRPGSRPATKPSDKPDSRPAARPGNKPSGKPAARPGNKPSGKPAARPGKPANRPPAAHRPAQRPPRVHPRDRDFLTHSVPRHYWAPDNHYYGYRIKTLPSRVVKHVYRGLTYYLYDNIWYRPYGEYYVVARPPFGTLLAANLIADMAWTIAKLSYYNTLTQPRAQVAVGLAGQLGLSQSYADASTTYYYQDGVFYSIAPDGQYYVIVPPAGALVEKLPEDFETIYLGGEKYFKVDDTIYQFTVSEGKPYFEVIGQMN